MPKHLHLAWDKSRASIQIGHSLVFVAPAKSPPFAVDAIVEEQDTSLILGEFHGEIPQENKPGWYLANTLTSQPVHRTGHVLVKHGSPVKFYAIVHDLEQQPSWRSDWIEQALDNLLTLADKLSIAALQLPVLGARHGNVSLEEFLSLLVTHLHKQSSSFNRKIWLLVSEQQYLQAISLLRAQQKTLQD